MDTPVATYEDFATAYARALGRKSKAALEARARQGRWMRAAPLGYRNVAHRVKIDPVACPLVKEAFYLAGRRDASLRSVAVELAARGLADREGRPLAASSLRHILLNPFYLGVVRHNGATYEGQHEPLVCPSAFERAGRGLKRRRR